MLEKMYGAKKPLKRKMDSKSVALKKAMRKTYGKK
tara:strand:- start:444 stop:548 length:105 start_codon:yes stop_codon:yes gene_type:complete